MQRAAEAGLSGFECLAGIPGTAGGALRMNAGGKHGTVSRCLKSLTFINRRGTVRTVDAVNLAFPYRGCPLEEDDIIISAVFECSQESAEAVRKRMRAVLAEKKAVQPLAASSLGCVFRNPSGDSAGRLIDACGFKGESQGGIQVSPLHANFLVNTGGGTAADMSLLMKRIQNGVKRKTGTVLEPEIVFLGDCGWRR
jgi:UDP-N-acetylmuramate dehydrogenase